jgi:hypothetical protein
MLRDFSLADEAHAIKLLTIAAEAIDRREEARATIAKDGAYVLDRYGCTKAHPALAVERDQAVIFARALRELALPLGNADSSRPPRVGTGARD